MPVDPAHARHQAPALLGGGVELCQLIRPADAERAARTQQGVRGKAFGRRAKETPAADRQAPDDRVAVSLAEQSGGAARRVVAGLALAFQKRDAAVRRKAVAGRRPGDSGADYEIVEAVHGKQTARLNSSRAA